jgi:ethanolamine utilization protein EutA
MRQDLLSVGIDIGTSTTQLVFSRLTVENLASDYAVPRISIVKKAVIFKSGIYYTPLLCENEIDADGIKKIIAHEYRKAGILPNEVTTGAVIITGETARKRNAEKVLESISAFAGDFVVTTAGPTLESALSGRGAGTDELSKSLRGTVVNIDVGGGTSNLSVFDKGCLAAVTCLDIGGRLVKIDRNTRAVQYIAPKIKTLAVSAGIDLVEGTAAEEEKLSALCGLMADMLFAAAGVCEEPPLYRMMFTACCTPPAFDKPPNFISFSGGVADCVYQNVVAEPFRYGDIGVLLGRELRRRCENYGLRLCRSRETIRATVIGAGLHTTEISGSTIFCSRQKATVKNAAVLKIPENRLHDAAAVIRERLKLYLDSENLCNIAIAFDGTDWSSYEKLQMLAQQIVQGAEPIIKSENPLIVLTGQDIAKALGHALDHVLSRRKEIICIDGIKTLDGDYIDIGMPIAGGSVVPVIVKTLIFN